MRWQLILLMWRSRYSLLLPIGSFWVPGRWLGRRYTCVYVSVAEMDHLGSDGDGIQRCWWITGIKVSVYDVEQVGICSIGWNI